MKFALYTFTVLVLLLVQITAKAQFVDYGADPARLKWSIVKTPHYKLLYPRGNDSLAYRYAVFLENVLPHVSKTIGMPKTATFPIAVVLHPNNMLSNGMVAWAPRRMELVTTPSPDMFAQNWDKQLAIHESRHVLQTGKLLQGIFKPLYYAIGEQSAGLAAFGIPRWFFEGDAVSTETALSSSGRGRLPEFNMIYRAQIATGNFHSFDKWFLGSYKDDTGDFYALGYNLTAYARLAYGGDVWDKVISRYAKRIYAIPPFSNALKHYTGVNAKQLFNETFAYLSKEWDEQKNDPQKLTYLSPDSKHYTSYNSPQMIDDSTVIAIKSGLRDINSIVILSNGKEKHLSYLGKLSSGIVLRNERIYWTEYVPGLRWAHENYSVVKYYDINKKHVVTLTPRQRYFSPAVNHNGQVVVSQTTAEGKNYIALIDTDNGDVIKQYPALHNAFIKDMVFGDNGNIIASAVKDDGLSLFQLNTHTGNWYGLQRPTTANITSLNIQSGKLYFESGFSGINNIYYLDTLSLQTHKLTSTQFGAFEPTLTTNDKQLVFSDYQANGYRIASLTIDSLKPSLADIRQLQKLSLAESLKQQEGFVLDSAKLNPVQFEPKPYRRGLNLFKIHSWAPFYYDVTEAMNLTDDFTTIVKPGATVLSQNTLNTAITQAGWYYKDGYHHAKLTFVYTGWFPVINLNVDYGDKAFEVKWEKDKDGKNITRSYPTNKNLVEVEAQVYIPFNLTRNHNIKGFQPSVSYNYTNNAYHQFGSDKKRDFQYVLSELKYYHYRRLAQRDILPRLGYQIRLQSLNTPFDNENFGSLYAARLTGYLPSFIRNDGLMIRLGYQYQNIDDKYFYIPEQLLEKARGYNYLVRTRQQWAFKADYSFNIICPDVAIGSLAYVKRIRANVFYDMSRNQAGKQVAWANQSSVGADLIFDWNAFRLNYPLSLGVRVIKPINYGNVQAEALFSIAFQ